MKMTMLEMVKNIMSALDSDELDSITDTVEGEQVATVIRDTYWLLVENKTIPEHQSMFQLTSAGSPALVYMLIPTTVGELEWVQYNVVGSDDTDNKFVDIDYRSPYEFTKILTARISTDDNIIAATDPTSGLALDMFQNDKRPEFWTSFDDQYICFDSYDAEVDASGLVGTKSLCFGSIIPTFTVANSVTDAFTPDLDDNLFPLLLAEAKSTCFMNIKQMPNPKIEKQARDQKVFSQNDKYRTAQTEKASTSAPGPDYGRRRR